MLHLLLKVTPLSRYYPTNSSEHFKVTALLEEARKTLKDVLVGGNDIKAALYISAIASMIREFPNVSALFQII